MRTFHRLCAIIAFVGLLFLAVTGVWIQILDLNALLMHAPETDPVIQAIREGKYGNDQYPVISVVDYTAAPLPIDIDHTRLLGAVLDAFHTRTPGVNPEFLELRAARATTIGQVGVKGTLSAFDMNTGASVAPIYTEPAHPPPQLRETLKVWHRFWIGHHIVGFWIGLTLALALLILTVTGSIVYLRLHGARVKLKRPQLFWFAGGWWRSLHRMVSVVAAVLLLAVGLSGTLLGLDSVWGNTKRNVLGAWAAVTGSPAPPTTLIAETATVNEDPTLVLSDPDKVRLMANATLEAFRREEPETPIKVVRLRVYAHIKQGVVVTGGPVTRQVVVNTDTGRIMSLTEPGYPPARFPFGIQMHENFKHFHSGEMFGLPARGMDLLAGLSLVYLCVSGLVMYLELWNKRRRAGRGSFLWT